MSNWPLLYLRYLALPARTVPLLLVASFAVGLAFASFAGLLGLPLLLVLSYGTLAYGFVMFDAASRGLPDPPVLTIEMMNPAYEWRPLAMIAIVLVFYGAVLWLQNWLGSAAGGALILLGLLWLPASLMTLAVTDRLLDAINPALLVKFVLRLGRDYLLLILVVVGTAFLMDLIEMLPLWSVIDEMIGLYAGFALFCLMGGMVYERRDELGVDAWQAPEVTAARDEKVQRRAFDRELDDIYSHVRAGAIEEAWQALDARLAAGGHAFEVYRRYYDRLATWPDSRLTNRLAKDWVARHGERASMALSMTKPGPNAT